MSEQPSGAKHVLVLGGGFGGLTAATAVRRHLDPGDVVTVVDQHGAHTQGLSLLWIMRGWRAPDSVLVKPHPAALPGIELLQAEVQELNLDDRKVHTDAGTLNYDALIIALGAAVDVTLAPGLAEALESGTVGEFYTTAGAADSYRRLSSMRSGRLALVVSAIPYKCPGAPWEAAFLAGDLLRENGVRDAVDVDIYTPEPQPMPVAGPVVGAGVVDMLDAHGIRHHFNSPLQRVDGRSRQLTFATGETAEFDEALFIPPHRPPAALQAAKFSDPGWIPVDPHTLATKIDGVWAVGDNASITLTNGKPLPKAAVFARGQAEAAAAGAARYVGRTAPEVRFDGLGHCYLETGAHTAAKGAGNFYAEGGPVVELFPPSVDMHEEKQREEAAWLAEWNAPAHSSA